MSDSDGLATRSPGTVPVTEQMILGPYYGLGGPIRSDIREDRDGARLDLSMMVLDIATGEPIPRAKVNIWHADASGHYSGYPVDPDSQPLDVIVRPPSTDESFLRGAQYTDDNGTVTFTTIYVGWYATRAPHVHIRVDIDDNCFLVSQLFFPEEANGEVYERPEYRRTAEQDSFNATDVVIAASDGAAGNWIAVERRKDRYIGTATVGIDRSARPLPYEPPPDFRPPVGGVRHDHPVR